MLVKQENGLVRKIRFQYLWRFNQTMEFRRFIENYMRNTFLEKSCTKCCEKASLRSFLKKSKLSISLDQKEKQKEVWNQSHRLNFSMISEENCRSSEEDTFSQNKTLEQRDCVCDLLQILNLWMDMLNYRAIKLVTYTACMCLNRSRRQCVFDKFKRSNYHCNY